MPLQIAVGAYFVLFLPSEVSKMGRYIFLHFEHNFYILSGDKNVNGYFFVKPWAVHFCAAFCLEEII